MNSEVSTQCQRFPSLSCAALVRCLRYSFEQILSFHHVSSSPSNCSVSSSAASLSSRSAENLLALWKTCRKRCKNTLIKTFAWPCSKATQWQMFSIQEHQLSNWPSYCMSPWARPRVRSIVGTHSGLLWTSLCQQHKFSLFGIMWQIWCNSWGRINERKLSYRTLLFYYVLENNIFDECGETVCITGYAGLEYQ